MAEKPVAARTISLDEKKTWKQRLLKWEVLLFILLIGINVLNSLLSKNYLNLQNLSNTLKIFLDKGIVAFPVMMVMLLGEIDISVGSQLALIGTIMGWAGSRGASLVVVMLLGLCVGAALGFINGYLISRFPQLSSTIITLGTEIFYRGLAWMILENRAYMDWPDGMQFLSWGDLGGIPLILIVFVVEFFIFAYIIHRTKFGRSLYAMGRNRNTSYYSGIRTKRNLITVYTVVGIFAAIASMFLVSKLGSARANMAKNYEMDIIAMVILGGVSVSGGVGNIVGVLMSIFVIGLLRYGLGLVNVSSEYIMIIIGALLIIPVALPNLKTFANESPLINAIRRKRKQHPAQ